MFRRKFQYSTHVKWETQEVKQKAGGKKALYQQLVDISLDHNLEQVVNIPTRGENISNIMFTEKSWLNKVSALPPLGKADHQYNFCGGIHQCTPPTKTSHGQESLSI